MESMAAKKMWFCLKSLFKRPANDSKLCNLIHLGKPVPIGQLYQQPVNAELRNHADLSGNPDLQRQVVQVFVRMA